MYLEREQFAHVEELEQQREAGISPGKSPEHLLRIEPQQFTEGSSFERSIGNPAGMVRAVAQHPRLADRAVARQRRCQQVGQPPAAPEPVLVDGLESQGIQNRPRRVARLHGCAHAFSIAALYSPRRAARLQSARWNSACWAAGTLAASPRQISMAGC